MIVRCSLLWSNQGEHWISQQWNPHLPLVRVMVEKGQNTEVCLWYRLFWKWIVSGRIVIAPARLALAMFVKVLETAHHMEEYDFEIKILWLGTASNLDVNVVKWKQKLAGGPGCLCWWATSLGGYPRGDKRNKFSDLVLKFRSFQSLTFISNSLLHWCLSQTDALKMYWFLDA